SDLFFPKLPLGMLARDSYRCLPRRERLAAFRERDEAGKILSWHLRKDFPELWFEVWKFAIRAGDCFDVNGNIRAKLGEAFEVSFHIHGSLPHRGPLHDCAMFGFPNGGIAQAGSERIRREDFEAQQR